MPRPLRRRFSARNTAWAVSVLMAALCGAILLFVQPPGAALRHTASTVAPSPAPRPEPGSLLHRVLEAHGGVERWRGIERLRVKLRFGGMAFKVRWIEPDPLDLWMELDLHTPGSVLSDYPEPGQRGVFTPDRVWIEGADGALLRSRDRPREVLLGSRRRQLWWDDLDLLYFAGYASWNYFQGPFLFLRDGVEVREIEPWQENGETWRRLAVRFHHSLPTHGPEQVFYYGEDFRQRRHDYTPDVFAAWADAAHYSSDYREFGGLWLPTRRRVLPRAKDNRSAAGPTLVWIDVRNVQLLPAR
jgi:hypothetical protein